MATPTLRTVAALVRWGIFKIANRGRVKARLVFFDHGSELHAGPEGRLKIGRRTRFLRDTTLRVFGSASIGDDVFFNRGAHIVSHERLIIGDRVHFGEKVSLHDDDYAFGTQWVGTPLSARPHNTAPIRVCDDVWVGAKVTVTRGVTIGEGSVVAANSVVSKDVPPYTLVAGAPARVVRSWADQRTDKSST